MIFGVSNDSLGSLRISVILFVFLGDSGDFQGSLKIFVNSLKIFSSDLGDPTISGFFAEFWKIGLAFWDP